MFWNQCKANNEVKKGKILVTWKYTLKKVFGELACQVVDHVWEESKGCSVIFTGDSLAEWEMNDNELPRTSLDVGGLNSCALEHSELHMLGRALQSGSRKWPRDL